MAAYILIPDSNPVKHVKKDITNADCTHLFTKYNYSHTVQEYEGYLPYTQKWVKGDIVKYQIWLHEVENCEIDIVDCQGKFIQNHPLNIVLPGYIINGIAYDICQFNIDTAALPAGDYYFLIKYKKASATEYLYSISEPQEIVEELLPSLLFKYKHSQNEYNTIYKTSFNTYFQQDFYFRVEGRVKDDKPGSNRQTYEDMRLDLTLLDAKPFDVWRFFFGSGRGVPPWVGSKLNMILSHNQITVDDNGFTFDELNKKDAGYYSRYLYEATARYSKINYVQQYFVPEPPVIEGGLSLPDAYENVGYSYIQSVSGDRPFTLTSIVKPAWMTIAVNGGDIVFGGTPANADIATGVTVSFTINNSAGTLPVSDTIDVLAVAACVSVGFAASTAIPNATVNVAYDFTVPLTGTAPFILSAIEKPGWLTLTPTAAGIRLTGTPTVVGLPAALSFDISNCGGGPSNTIHFAENLAVTSGVSITGNTSFSIGLPNGSGNIIATPGTLVYVTINATGATAGGYTLSAIITGATVSGSTTVTSGSQVFTFIMPAGGSVGWSATFTGVDSAGGGNISVL